MGLLQETQGASVLEGNSFESCDQMNPQPPLWF